MSSHCKVRVDRKSRVTRVTLWLRGRTLPGSRCGCHKSVEGRLRHVHSCISVFCPPVNSDVQAAGSTKPRLPCDLSIHVLFCAQHLVFLKYDAPTLVDRLVGF